MTEEKDNKKSGADEPRRFFSLLIEIQPYLSVLNAYTLGAASVV